MGVLISYLGRDTVWKCEDKPMRTCDFLFGFEICFHSDIVLDTLKSIPMLNENMLSASSTCPPPQVMQLQIEGLLKFAIIAACKGHLLAHFTRILSSGIQ